MICHKIVLCLLVGISWEIFTPVYAKNSDSDKNVNVIAILQETFAKKGTFDCRGIQVIHNSSSQVSEKYRFYCKIESENTLVARTEYTKGNNDYIAIRNDSGLFLLCEKNKNAVRTLDLSSVQIIEHPYLPITKNELEGFPKIGIKGSQYEISRTKYLGEECYKITMKVPDVSSEYLFIIFDYVTEENFPESVYPVRPFIREYVIGIESGFIYSKKCYNFFGDLIYSFECSSVEFNPDWTGRDYLFQCPENIVGTAENQEAAEEYILKYHNFECSSVSKFVVGITSELKNFVNFVAQSMLQQIILLISVGLFFVCGGIWIYTRKK